MRVFTCVQLAWLAVLIVSVSALGGCAPRHYRLSADRETYGIIARKSAAPAWHTPPFSVQPPPESRNFDRFDPDCEPLPPDDPAAHRDMQCVDGKRGSRHWHDRGEAPSIEDPSWQGYLDLNDDGELALDRAEAVKLGLLNSRTYQSELEDLYLAALSLTLERFEFQLQWFGTNRTFYDHFGSSSVDDPATDAVEGNESNTLSTTSNLGFRRALAGGGELLVDFANTFIWEFTGDNSHSTTSNIAIRLAQPLLRGAFRDVRLESLTQSERDVLYEVRDFARFRKQFYFDIVSGDDGYLSLLLQLQGIRNEEANLESLSQNLRAHEALAEAGIVSPLQVDQVFQSYQLGRLSLNRAQNRLETAQDNYKIQLGLPPELELDLDDTLLAPFELNSPEIVQLEGRLEELLVFFREQDQAPPRARIQQGFDELKGLHQRVVQQLDAVAAELERWNEQTEEADTSETDDAEKDDVDEAREREARRVLTRRLDDLRKDLQTAGREIDQAQRDAGIQPLEAAWESIQTRARQQSADLSELAILQTQIRVYLIELRPVELDLQQAIALGLSNRLDLMNRRAFVTDAWRKVRVAADGLQSDLDVVFEADVATEPGTKNPLNFSADASRYRVGFRLDGPLNRKAERNTYRSNLILYQRARRDFIAVKDNVVRAVRLDIRNLATDRLNFEITRQRLIVAARQVELAKIQLLAPGQAGDSSTTQDVLRALEDLLDAKNALIATWVTYETDRLQLLLDTELLQLDERGLPSDDNFDTDIQLELLNAPASEYLDDPAADE